MSDYVSPPANLLMQISNNPSEEAFRASFSGVQDSALKYCSAAQLDFFKFENILDFGCGVGRFLFAMREISEKNQKFYGVDINPDCAKWCKDNIRFAEIKQAPLSPPLDFPDNTFDYINAVSVFTHLTLDHQFAWAWEICRILKPGGVIALTTNGNIHVPFLLTLPSDLFPLREFVAFGKDGFFGSLSYDGSVENEGQREVVTMYSGDALKESFFPLEFLYSDPVSTLAGGQGISIFRKPMAFNIIKPKDWNGGFKFPAQRFSSNFRFYMSLDDDTFQSNDKAIDIAIADIHGNLKNVQGIKLNVDRVFKGRHLVPINFSIPHQDDDFVVHVGNQPSGDLPGLKINYPHLIVI